MVCEIIRLIARAETHGARHVPGMNLNLIALASSNGWLEVRHDPGGHASKEGQELVSASIRTGRLAKLQRPL
jgi:hypothetical protein